MHSRLLIPSGIVVALLAAIAYFIYSSYRPNAARLDKFRQWVRNPTARPD